VVIRNKDPDKEIQIFLERQEQNMHYLAGDPLLAEDMIKRAELHKSSSCIIMTDKNSQNSSEEDYKNILIALAVKKLVYDELKDANHSQTNIKLCLQLIKPESKDLYFKSLSLSPL
jgi:hypothetical protein